jgi:putative chitinase
LLQIMPFAKSRVHVFAAPLTNAMLEFRIASLEDKAAFLAQVAHESGSLVYMREIADGSAYEGRKDLGNTEPGDGKRFPGRGPIQITGRTNYLHCGKALGLDLIAHPELLEQPTHGCRGSAWFWQSRGLSALAERQAFGTITKRINGGFNGIDDRLVHWLRARKFFGI